MKPPPDLPKLDVYTCIDVCEGNAYAGVVLWLIQYWHGISRHVEEDKRWVRFTHDQVAKKTHISKSRVKTSLKYLVDNKIIERKHGIGSGAIHCSHVRLTVSGQKALWEGLTDKEVIEWAETGIAPVIKSPD